MRQDSPTLDVVICTKDRADDLQACLKSLASQERRPDHVIVVDAGTPRPDANASLPLSIEVHPAQAGLTRQRNVGLTLSDADFVAFLDDDVELEPHYLAAVLEWFALHGECVGVSGNIVNDEPRSRAARLYRAAFCLGNDDGRLRRSGDVVYLQRPVHPTPVDVLSGSNMVYRRSSLGGLSFDEYLHGYSYMEDSDFSLRVLQRGELWVVPEARLLHRTSLVARVPQHSYVRQVFSNGAYLFAKHRRGFHLSWSAYARRVLGRMLAYLLLAAARRSAAPVFGVVSGIASIRRALSDGSRAARE